jgi:hypothetical protein
VFLSIPASVSISGTTYTASKIWETQAIVNFPTITLNVSSIGAASDLQDVVDGVQYHVSLLTIHVLSKTITGGPHADHIAGELSQTIAAEIESWTDPLDGDVRIFDPEEDISAVTNMGTLKDTSVTDYTMTVKLHHA